jgi:hypothetical protein
MQLKLLNNYFRTFWLCDFVGAVLTPEPPIPAMLRRVAKPQMYPESDLQLNLELEKKNT